MKIIFLDFDGVLNSHAYWCRRSSTPPSEDRDVWLRWQIDPEAVQLLNKLVKKYEAEVVVSSSWRLLHRLPDLRSILRDRGFEGQVIGTTPRHRINRGTEIQEWLTINGPVKSFAILDDDSDMAHLMKRLVLVSYTVGLTELDLEKAGKLLETPLDPDSSNG